MQARFILLLAIPSALASQQSTAFTGAGRLSIPNDSPELEVTLVASGARQRRIIARGHALSISRDKRGQLAIVAPRIEARF